MMATDREALICDLAETYGIYDYRSLPASTVATLSCGLRESSRIKMKMAGEVLSFEQLMLVNIYDKIAWLAWSRTKSAQNGEDPPKALLWKILGKEEEKDTLSFSTGEEFERYRERVLRGKG